MCACMHVYVCVCVCVCVCVWQCIWDNVGVTLCACVCVRESVCVCISVCVCVCVCGGGGGERKRENVCVCVCLQFVSTIHSCPVFLSVHLAEGLIHCLSLLCSLGSVLFLCFLMCVWQWYWSSRTYVFVWQLYRLVTKQYIASGHDGYDVFKDCKLLVSTPRLLSSQCPHMHACSLTVDQEYTSEYPSATPTPSIFHSLCCEEFKLDMCCLPSFIIVVQIWCVVCHLSLL